MHPLTLSALLSPPSLILLHLMVPISSAAPHPAPLSYTPFSQSDNCTLPAPFSGTPNPCGCTRTSFSRWAWSLADFYFHSSVIFSTPSHQIDGGWVSFALSHPAVPSVAFDCSAYSEQLQDWFYGDMYYNCTGKDLGTQIIPGYGGVTAEGDGRPSGLAGTTAQFRFDKSSGRVDINSTWVCTEDPVHPIFFKASGSGTVSLSCNETRYQNTNWTSGQIYSTDFVECAKVNLTITPSEESATS